MTQIQWQTTLLEQADQAAQDNEPCIEIGLLLLAKLLDISRPSRHTFGRMLSDLTQLIEKYKQMSPHDVYEKD